MARISIDVGPAKAAIREAVKGVSLVVTAAGGDTWQNQGEAETVRRDFELQVTK